MFKWFKKKEKTKEELVENEELQDFGEEVNDDFEDETYENETIKADDDSKGDAEKEINVGILDIEDEIILDIPTEISYSEEVAIETETPIEKKLGLFEKLKNGLTKTRKDMSDKIDGLLKSYKKIDEELFEDLEEVLISADVGMNTTMELIDNLRQKVKEDKVTDPDNIKTLLKNEIRKLMLESVNDNELKTEPSPAVILVVGVNGVGKTTTIGKLSNNFKKQGKKVIIAAGDTFRAAAIEQLEEWSNRAGVEFIAHKEGADPAAVIFDGVQAAKARKSDILICDTAGRLHNKSNLMNELNKIFRVVEREYPNATKEILLVLDATTGQNAISQAKVFKEVTNITGVALTKLDGTAKGGVIIGLQSELKIPVKLVGVGEGIEDLQQFNVEDFVEAIFN
ncbi:signal recognition particle-docking protein FtsY [Tissierella sp.]|uniref:signal recognition particle-docking protein FtsY n=1 Tax=Tissierella sp. TaxID=41274 RepID=UPI0037DC134E